jgi:DnaJ-class molecular chaperone
MGKGQRSRGGRKPKHRRCPLCHGTGRTTLKGTARVCRRCRGVGYLRRHR